MSNKKLSSFDAVTTVDDADEFYVARSGEQKKITGADLKAAAGNGGSSSVNWCTVTLAVPDPREIGSENYNFQQADLSINSQSGSDFSVGDDGFGHGAILSAAGGKFQAAAYIGNPANATLDGSSDVQRYLWFGISLGDVPALAGLGFDTTIPVVTSGRLVTDIANCGASSMGIANPGGKAAWNFQLNAIGLVGTDSVPLDFVFGWPMVAIWQI